MRIALVAPTHPGLHGGNRTTALRWAGMLRKQGHHVCLGSRWDGTPADVLLALHALKSREAVLAFQRAHPDRPVLLALTGTDVYHAIHASDEARDTLWRADRVIVLQPLAVEELPAEVRPRARVIYQSASRCLTRPTPLSDVFEVCVLAGLRSVKDPLLCARAARRLPPESRVRIEHCGAPLEPALIEECFRESADNPRYHWHGDQSHRGALERLARSRLLVLSSRLEGGANVISEALSLGVPVLATRIPGSVGLLGTDYEGYFPVEDEAALSGLLRRAESDEAWHGRLREQCRGRRALVDPARESGCLERLLKEVA